MKIETKEIYKCDFCNKLYQIKRFAEKHEKQCSRNPENNRPCFKCQFLEKKNSVIRNPDYFNDDEIKVSVLSCSAKNIFLFPPKVEIKENQYDLLDGGNEPMPKECSDFKICSYLN